MNHDFMTILDEFSARKDVSRQRRWQLRKQADGLCPICGKKAIGMYCRKHAEAHRACCRKWMRENLGCKPSWKYRHEANKPRKH